VVEDREGVEDPDGARMLVEQLSEPSWRVLTLMQTVSGTVGEAPCRVARKTCPNPPAPSMRPMR